MPWNGQRIRRTRRRASCMSHVERGRLIEPTLARGAGLLPRGAELLGRLPRTAVSLALRQDNSERYPDRGGAGTPAWWQGSIRTLLWTVEGQSARSRLWFARFSRFELAPRVWSACLRPPTQTLATKHVRGRI